MVESLEKILRELLECPVCKNYMCTPIGQCELGHSICNSCFSLLKFCPICRSRKSNGRSHSVEAIHFKINIPCKYADGGCNFVSLGEHIGHHETYCALAARYCPLKPHNGCEWKDSNTKLFGHLRQKHSQNFRVHAIQYFFLLNFKEMIYNMYFCVIIYAHKEYFKLTVNLYTEGMIRWAVQYIGNPENAGKYSYKIEFARELIFDISTSLIWTANCEGISTDEDEREFRDYNGLHLHKDFVNSYVDSNNGYLLYRVTIHNRNELVINAD